MEALEAILAEGYSRDCETSNTNGWNIRQQVASVSVVPPVITILPKQYTGDTSATCMDTSPDTFGLPVGKTGADCSGATAGSSGVKGHLRSALGKHSGAEGAIEKKQKKKENLIVPVKPCGIQGKKNAAKQVTEKEKNARAIARNLRFNKKTKPGVSTNNGSCSSGGGNAVDNAADTGVVNRIDHVQPPHDAAGTTAAVLVPPHLPHVQQESQQDAPFHLSTTGPDDRNEVPRLNCTESIFSNFSRQSCFTEYRQPDEDVQGAGMSLTPAHQAATFSHLRGDAETSSTDPPRTSLPLTSPIDSPIQPASPVVCRTPFATTYSCSTAAVNAGHTSSSLPSFHQPHSPSDKMPPRQCISSLVAISHVLPAMHSPEYEAKPDPFSPHSTFPESVFKSPFHHLTNTTTTTTSSEVATTSCTPAPGGLDKPVNIHAIHSDLLSIRNLQTHHSAQQFHSAERLFHELSSRSSIVDQQRFSGLCTKEAISDSSKCVTMMNGLGKEDKIVLANEDRTEVSTLFYDASLIFNI